MRTSLLSLLGALFVLTGQAQDTIPLYSEAIARQKTLFRPAIGVDLYQAAWVINSVFSHDSPATYAYPLSITFYLPARSKFDQHRTVYVNAGYVAYGGTSQRNIYQTGGSIHIRSGIELTRHTLLLGYGGLVTGWSGQGSFYFKGPTFGDYRESIGTLSGLAIAGEGHIGFAVPFGNRLSLRTLLRGSVLYRLTTSQYGLYAPHLSGVDWQSERSFGIGVSLQANLVFQL